MNDLPIDESRRDRFTLFEQYFYDKLGSRIAVALSKRSVTPNQVTLAGLIIAAVSSILLFEGSYGAVIGGVLLLQVSVLADYVDGNVARLRGMGSEFGKWLDTNCAQMADVLVFSGVTAGLYRISSEPEVLAWGMFTLAARFVLKSHILSTYYSPFYLKTFSMYTGLGRVLREFVPHRPLLYLVLTVAAVLDQMLWALIGVGAYCAVGYFGLWFVSYRRFKCLDIKKT